MNENIRYIKTDDNQQFTKMYKYSSCYKMTALFGRRSIPLFLHGTRKKHEATHMISRRMMERNNSF